MANLWLVTEIRIRSISDPIAGSPDVARCALYSVFRADVMDLLPRDVDERGEVDLDAAFLGDLTERVIEAGLGSALLKLHAGASAEETADLVRSIWQALDDSPYPQGEWGGVRERLDDEQLADLLGISTSSVRRYASGERQTPDEIAWRLHTLSRIIAALTGSYNDYGIRRWFVRPRPQLGGGTPTEVFARAGGEDDPELMSLVRLAEALVGPAIAA